MGEGVIAYGVAGGLLAALLLLPVLYGELPAHYVMGWTPWGPVVGWVGAGLAAVTLGGSGFLAARADGGGAARGALAGALAGGIAFAAVGAAAAGVAGVGPFVTRLQGGPLDDLAFFQVVADSLAAVVIATTAGFWIAAGGGALLGTLGGGASRAPRRRLALNPAEANAPLGMLLLGVAIVPALSGTLGGVSEVLARSGGRQGTGTWQAVAVQTAPLLSWLGILAFAMGWAWSIAGRWRHNGDPGLRRSAGLLAILALVVPVLLSIAGAMTGGLPALMPGVGLAVLTLWMAVRAMRRPPPLHPRRVDHSLGGAVAGGLLAGLWWTITLVGGGLAAGVPIWLVVQPFLPVLSGQGGIGVPPDPVDAVQDVYETSALLAAGAVIAITLCMAVFNATMSALAQRRVRSA